jgi:Fe-S cluster assembly protein SufD
MSEKPVIVTRTRRSTTSPQEFTFTRANIPQSSNQELGSYRARAWEDFQALPVPDGKQEAWRRTDIHAMPQGTFRIPGDQAYLDLAPVPDDLLQPVTGEAHGGQIVIMPGGAQSSLDAELSAQGVIFTDLASAEREHPELVARLKGQIVKANEGKFSALAGALAQTGILVYIPKGVTVAQP